MDQQQQQRELEEGGGLFGASSTASSLRASTSLGMGLGLAASGSLLRAPPRQEVGFVESNGSCD